MTATNLMDNDKEISRSREYPRWTPREFRTHTCIQYEFPLPQQWHQISPSLSPRTNQTTHVVENFEKKKQTNKMYLLLKNKVRLEKFPNTLFFGANFWKS